MTSNLPKKRRAVTNASPLIHLGRVGNIHNAQAVGIGDGEEIAKHNLFVGQKILIYNAGKGAYPEVPGTENVVIVPEGALLIEMMDEDEMTFAMNEALGIHIDTIAEEHAKPYDPCLNPYGYGKTDGKTDTTPPQEDPEK